jgi:O-antigen ligase
MAFTAVAVVLLLPLLIAPGVLFYYDITPKVALLMIGAAAGLVFAWDSILRFWKTAKWFCIAVAGSLAIAGVATWMSAERELAWFGSNWRRLGALTEWAALLAALWIAAWAVRSERNVVILLRTICGAGLIAALYGIAQYFGWDPILPRSAYEVGEGVFQIVRPPGTMGHSDYFSAFLLWPVFAGAGLAAREQSALWRRLAIAAASAGSVAIVLSGSRGALVGLAAGAIVRVALARGSWRIVAAGGGALVVLLALVYVSPAGERLRARVHWISEEPAGGARLLLWRDSLKMAMEKPVVGFGPDAFVAEFPKFESVDLARAFPDFYHESPHNLFLDALTREGILGLLALIVASYLGISGGLVARGSTAALAMLPALIASVVTQQFVVFIAPTLFFFYVGAGVLAGSASREERTLLKPRAVRRVALVGGLIAAGVMAVAAYRLVRQDAALQVVQAKLDTNDAMAAAEAYRAALAKPNAGVTADLFLSRRFFKSAVASNQVMPRLYVGQVAAGSASRATRLPEQLPNAWFNMAVLSASREDVAGTEYALRAAIEAAPNWYKPHWMLARVMAARGNGAEAASEAKMAIALNAGKDAEVESTLAQIIRSAPAVP